MDIRPATAPDSDPLSKIYNYYIATSHATFELAPIDAADMLQRIQNTIVEGLPFLVAEVDGSIAGYAYGRPFRPRPGYKHTVEVAVYVDVDSQGKGIAQALYRELFEKLFEAGAHSLIATISLPNDRSVRLHERLGFVKTGHFREVGRKFDRWIDVGYWQLLR